MDQDRVHRDTLYKEVWSTPMVALAPKYGVSAVFLARVCARLDVPCPPRGYWAKKQSGQRLKIPPLPKLKADGHFEWKRGDQLIGEKAIEPIVPTPKNDRARRSLVMGSLAAFTSGRVAGDGYLKPNKRNLPDFVVTENSLKRAALILLKLATAFGELKHRVVAACVEPGYTRKELGVEGGRLKRSVWESNVWKPGCPTLVFIGETAVGLTIYEQTIDRDMVDLDGKYVPVKEAKAIKPGLWDRKTKTFYRVSSHRVASKRLCLRAYSPFSRVDWSETWTEDKASLAKQVDLIVASLCAKAEVLAKQVSAANQQAEEERKRWERERQIAHAEHQRAQILKAREDSLRSFLRIVDRWSDSKKLERFFDDIVTRSESLDGEARSQLLSKIQEAKALVSSPDIIAEILTWASPPPPADE